MTGCCFKGDLQSHSRTQKLILGKRYYASELLRRGLGLASKKSSVAIMEWREEKSMREGLGCRVESKPHSNHRSSLALDKAAFLDVISESVFSSYQWLIRVSPWSVFLNRQIHPFFLSNIIICGYRTIATKTRIRQGKTAKGILNSWKLWLNLKLKSSYRLSLNPTFGTYTTISSYQDLSLTFLSWLGSLIVTHGLYRCFLWSVFLNLQTTTPKNQI